MGKARIERNEVKREKTGMNIARMQQRMKESRSAHNKKRERREEDREEKGREERRTEKRNKRHRKRQRCFNGARISSRKEEKVVQTIEIFGHFVEDMLDLGIKSLV